MLEPLGFLAPRDGHDLKASLCHAAEYQQNGKDRQIRRDADAAMNWTPEAGVAVRLTYEEAAVEDYGDERTNDRTATVIRIVHGAERRLSFVGLKWLRDQLLPNNGREWAQTPSECYAAVQEAVQQGGASCRESA